MAPSLTSFYRDQGQQMAVWGNVVLVQWLAPPKPANFRLLGQYLATQAQRRDGKLAVLSLITSIDRGGADEPDNHFDRELADPSVWAAVDSSRIAATAHVVTLTGLRGVSTRTFLGALALVPSRTGPIKVFPKVADGCAWLQSTVAIDAPSGGGTLLGAAEGFMVTKA